jgi:diaminopimelate epimerase
MIREIEVYRMSGAGNLFSVIDNSDFLFNDVQLIELAGLLCNINEFNNFKSEGLLAVSKSNEDDFDVKFLNPDGSTGMMCGNGGRCAIDFAIQKSISKNRNGTLNFSMAGNKYSGEISIDGVKLILPPPKRVEFNKQIEIMGKKITGTFVNVTSDHFVVNFKDLRDFDLEFNIESINKFAPSIRLHPDFGLSGVNVNIYGLTQDTIYLYTYERGVEAVTGACGTGAVSTAIHCEEVHKISLPITISPPSAIPIYVNIEKNYSNEIKNLQLTGHSEIIRKDLVKLMV